MQDEAIRMLRHHLDTGGFVKVNARHWNAKPSDGADLIAIPRWSLLQIIGLLEGRRPEEREPAPLTEAEKQEEWDRYWAEADMPGGFT